MHAVDRDLDTLRVRRSMLIASRGVRHQRLVVQSAAAVDQVSLLVGPLACDVLA